MTNQELERRLAGAMSRLAPNDLEGVLSRCVEQKGDVILMKRKKKNPVMRNLVAACLAVVLLGGGMAYRQAYAVTSIVSLDVNPSIELEVNRNEKVLVCKPLNEEAETVLAGMNGGADLKGTKLNVAVNAVVGALMRNGYLDSISSAILISVEDGDQTRAARLQQEVTAEVDTVLLAQASEAAVFSQTVKRDTALEKQAKENGISTGKAALINRITEVNKELPFEKLAALSAEELKDLLEAHAPGLPIGKAAAKDAAMHYAGVAAQDRVRWEVDAELDDTPAHYEVELYVSGKEFAYVVDAYTGEVLRGKANVTSNGEKSPALSAADAGKNKEPAEEKKPSKPAASVPEAVGSAAGEIGESKAKAAALSHAGLAESRVSRLEIEMDREDGRAVYEVEFKAERMEYEYTIDALTGAVLEHEQDWDD